MNSRQLGNGPLPTSAPALRDRATDASARLNAPVVTAAGTGGASGQVSNDVRRFEAAKLSSEQRDVKSLGDERKDALNESDARVKVAGARTFQVNQEGVWLDLKKQTATRTVKVKAYSEAYFALLRAVPELAQWFAVGDRVRVNGRAVTIELADDGVSTLDGSAVAALVKDWQ